VFLTAIATAPTVHGGELRRAVTAHRAGGPIVIDGRLDEPDWQQAAQHTRFLAYSAPGVQLADPQTTMQVLFDDRAIYFGFVAMEPLMDRLRAAVAEPNADIEVYSDDSIELMLAPDPGADRYFHFVFNALGNYGDRLMQHAGAAADASWHAGLDSAGSRGPDRYTVEVRIPFSQLEFSVKVGTTWRFQVARNRRVLTGQPTISVFSKCTSGFHCPDEFAELNGMDADLRRYLCRVTSFQTKEIFGATADGSRARGEVYVENRSGAFVAFEVTGKAWHGSAKPATFSARGGLASGDSRSFPVEFVVPQDGDYRMAIELRRLPEREVLQTRQMTVSTSSTPMKMVMRRPYYRQAIYPDQDIREIEVSLMSTLPPATWRGKALRLCIVADDGRKLANVDHRDLAKLDRRWSLAVPRLPQGEYRVRAQIMDGPREVARAERKLRVIRQTPFFYRVDEHGRLIRNGRPLLLLGIEGGFDFERLAAWGFNYTTLIGHYRKTRTELVELVERASRHGMMVGFNVADWTVKDTWRHQPLPPEHRKRLAEMVELSRGIEAIAMWMLRDEPECYNVLPELLEDTYRTLWEADPLRPVGITNCSLTGLLTYARAADIRRPDPYPGFWDDGSWFQEPTFVSDRVDQIFSTPANRQICALPILQAFGHGDTRPRRSGPSFAALRNMTWLAVVHGARGMSFYSWNGIMGSPGLRVGMPALLKEIRALEPFILAVDAVEAQAESPHVHVLARRHGDHVTVCAVNVTQKPVQTTIRISFHGAGFQPAVRRKPRQVTNLPHEKTADPDRAEYPSLDEPRLHVVSEGRSVQAKDGRFEDTFGAVGVHIYTTDPKLGAALEGLSQIQAAVAAEDRRRTKPNNLAFYRRQRRVNFSPNARIRKAHTPFDGYEEGYGWMPVAQNLRDENPVWLEVEFDTPQQVGRVRAVVRRIEQYELSVYDGHAWRTLEFTTQDRLDQQKLCRLFDTAATLSPPLSVSKVRFSVPRSTTGNMWWSLQELEVFAPETEKQE